MAQGAMPMRSHLSCREVWPYVIQCAISQTAHLIIRNHPVACGAPFVLTAVPIPITPFCMHWKNAFTAACKPCSYRRGKQRNLALWHSVTRLSGAYVGALTLSRKAARHELSRRCAHAGQFTEAQAERWWEHYIAVKLDLVQSVLQDDVGSGGDAGGAGSRPWGRTGSSPAR